ncbi:MAG TPA: hypothetical protein VKV04_10210 [Verrucomicrobiae bacterium]|nr:hypothetical protein [Verrucomicrobiae bacterium]
MKATHLYLAAGIAGVLVGFLASSSLKALPGFSQINNTLNNGN